MKICTLQAPDNSIKEALSAKSLFERYAELAEENKNVCIVQVGGYDFIVKALGRRDFKDIMTNTSLNHYLKEEAICEICCLYPSNFNFEECEAGIASGLFKEIISFSFLSNSQEEERSKLMSYFRNEMLELHNQINCMISEAFPSLRFDEIENFDMLTAIRYLSRAEWILQNMRGFEMMTDPFTGEVWSPDDLTEPQIVESTQPAQNYPQEPQEEAPKMQRPKVELPQQKEGSNATQNNGFIPGETIEQRLERLKKGEIQPKKLTPEKLRQLQRDFPDIDWTSQSVENDFESNVDTTPMALRTPDQIYKRSE